MAKCYKCDACGETIENPYKAKMKEFCIACRHEVTGTFPWNTTYKTVVDLCDNCFHALREIAIAALRPVSREQVEKVLRGEWEDMRESYNDVPKRRCSRCKSVFIGLDTPFCEVCGAPMTDEAVDIRLKELEALKDGSTTD